MDAKQQSSLPSLFARAASARALISVLLPLCLFGCESPGFYNNSGSASGRVESASPWPAEGSESENSAPQGSVFQPRSSSPQKAPDLNGVVAQLQRQGEGYLNSQQWYQAISVAERGLRIDRRHSGFYRVLSYAYDGLGDTAQAQRFARQASRLCGEDCAAERRLMTHLGR